MDLSESFKDFQERLSAALVATARTAGQIAQEDVSFQRSLDSQVSEALDRHSSQLLSLANRLTLKAADGLDLSPSPSKDADDLETNWSGIVDVVDSLLERADTSLDEYTGRIKRAKPAQTHQVVQRSRPKPPGGFSRSLEIKKPQLDFPRPPVYDEQRPFKPLLRRKPHAIVPLEDSLVSFQTSEDLLQYKNPYETEIIHAQYPDCVFARCDPVPFKPFEQTTATYVDTLEGLRAMVAELRQAKEIAVDLEHHETRTYGGLVCLMQISTREKDWIIDTLKPWREDLQVLNEVFADPHVLKVFHGAYMDIVWLQRDFGLYVIALFDTYHASRALGYPQASLAYLLSHFVHFNANKQYQLADWRTRPLPKEMFEYARSDTHFLLFIYDHLRNELLDKTGDVSNEDGPMFDVINNSRQTSLLRYQGHQYGSDELGTGPAGWYNMLKRSPVNLSKEQFAVFKAVHRWRDRVARQNDEGVSYVIPKYALFAIAQAMPMDLDSLIRVASSIGQPARVRIGDLLEVIKTAKTAGVSGPDMSTVLASLQKSRGGSPPPGPIRTRSSRTVAAPAAAAAKPHAGSDVNMLDAGGSVVLNGDFPARSSVSQFWGSTFGSSIWESAAGKATTANGGAGNIQLALPLPHLTAEVFEDAQNGSPQAPRTAEVADPGARAEIPFTRDRPKPPATDDDVFVIKQLGGSRKRKAMDASQQAAAAPAPRGTQQDPVLLDEDDGDDAATKEEEASEEKEERGAESRKARSREEKRARRQERKRLRAQTMATEVDAAGRQPAARGAAGDGDESIDEAFDYATAAAALQADTAKARRAQPANQFKPYSGGARGGGAGAGAGADGPSAARAVRRDQAGRTMTFTK